MTQPPVLAVNINPHHYHPFVLVICGAGGRAFEHFLSQLFQLVRGEWSGRGSTSSCVRNVLLNTPLSLEGGGVRGKNDLHPGFLGVGWLVSIPSTPTIKKHTRCLVESCRRRPCISSRVVSPSSLIYWRETISTLRPLLPHVSRKWFLEFFFLSLSLARCEVHSCSARLILRVWWF